MPIELTPVTHGTLCHGHKWEISDEDRLAELIGLVALGQARHVLKIQTTASGITAPAPTKTAAKAAIAMLTVTGEPWHRDGWMFQVMSWIAAHKASPDSLLKAPQMTLADKGIDGLRVDIDSATGKISSVVIFEDKATTNPRKTIREEVWPELVHFESGARDNVLVAELTALAEAKPGLNVDQLIENVLWTRDRSFRISITTDDSYATDAAREGLFKGFDVAVNGKEYRRGAETFLVPDMRKWMQSIASKAIASINKMI